MSEPADVTAPRRPDILRTALLLLPLQGLLRGGEAVLPLLLAAWFGRGAETDLYYLLAAYFVFAAAFLTGAFQDSGVVPVLIEIEAKDPQRFPEIAGALLGHTLAVGAVVALGLGLLAAAIALFTSHLWGLALQLIALMAAGTVATSVRAFYVGLLNARSLFRAHPIASGSGMGLALLLIALGRHALGVRIIPAGLLAGELLAIAILSWLCRRTDPRPIVASLARPEPVRRIFRLVGFEVTGSLITRINPVIDQLMSGLAAVLGGGTLLRYATDVASLPTSILQATLFPVFLTRVSQEAGTPAFLATTKKTLLSVTGILAAASLVLFAVRVPLCRLLFLHGAMDEDGALRIADILPWALVGVAPFGALLVLARAHVALQNSRIMPSMGVLNSTLNAVLNGAFVYRFGLSGIALSTSVTYVVVAAVFWLRLPKVTGDGTRTGPPPGS